MRRKLILSSTIILVLVVSFVVVIKADFSIWSQTYGGTENDSGHSLVATSDGGYAIAGSTESFGAGSLDAWLVKVNATGNMEWNMTYGGTETDGAKSVVETTDGGYAIAGTKASDFWLVKTDAAGNMEWNQTYGGTDGDYVESVVETADGGYALAGSTQSFGGGYWDFWFVKTDEYGNMEWNKTYGGAEDDNLYSLVSTSDGGYALAGRTRSYGAGTGDFWLIKTDETGVVEWNKTYGGTDYEYAFSMVVTNDGGYALAGETNSFDVGHADAWLVKTDAYGNMQWNKTYGVADTGEKVCRLVVTLDGGYAMVFEAGNDFLLVKTDELGNIEWNKPIGEGPKLHANSLLVTDGGAYVIAGRKYSDATDDDLWLLKLDPSEKNEWNRTYGGTEDDEATVVIKTSDGGYAIAGYTRSFGAGIADFWLIKTDEFGNTEWNKTYGGTKFDSAWALAETEDGGYAIAGYTQSFGVGGDAWLVKTDMFGNMEWNKTYGGTESDGVSALIVTSDGGYALAGKRDYEFWLIKTDVVGNMEWNKTYAKTFENLAHALVETLDGGYALAGTTGSGPPDCWLVKTDASGNMEWNRTYGEVQAEEARSLVVTSDGGYVMAGGNVVVKTDEFGNIEWNRTCGNIGLSSVIKTSDGGYAVSGYFYTSGAETMEGSLIKIDAFGNVEWNTTYGGHDRDETRCLVEAPDGGYVITGGTWSFGAGGEDFWLVKTKGGTNRYEFEFTVGGSNYSVDMSSNSTIGNCNLDPELKQLNFTVTGSNETTGFCNVTIPEELLWGDFTVYLNETTLVEGVDYTVTSNGTHNTFYITYNHSSHTIAIEGTNIVPEYNSWITPTLLLATILIAIAYKKKKQHT